MNNKVILTDDELCVIQTTLAMILMSHEQFVKLNGESALDQQSKNTIRDAKALHDRLQKEYF